jgi:hypothetical protein
MNTETAAALKSLATATTKREKTAALRRMAVLFYIACREMDAASRDILHEKLNNYAFDISPYSPR